MRKTINIQLICSILISWAFMQECPPSDTLSIAPAQNLWNIPTENYWNEIEIMTWNIKNFPISSNTIDYVNEIITDILPDIIAFQEVGYGDVNSFLSLANSIPAYEFLSTGSGLALAVRSDVIEIINWSTLFPTAGYEFAWRYPLLVELRWVCGGNASSIHVINVHLKSGGDYNDFQRRYDSCIYLSNYINDNPYKNIIIAGDYNDEITDSQSSNSLWPLITNDNVSFATSSIADIEYYASYPSWPSFIDHIALSSPLFDELNTSEIKTVRIDDYTGYSTFQNNISDHRPVLWRFSVQEVTLTTDIVINEIMKNPTSVSDALGEWIEITNISNSSINLNGLILRDDGEEYHVISNDLIILPNEYLVLGSNNNILENGGVIIDYVYNSFSLSNLWDEVIIEHPNGTIIDAVYYDNGEFFPDENGKSMMLINPNLDNNIGINWAIPDTNFGDGDYGTPGTENYQNDCPYPGDMNNDASYNVLDIVSLANCILEASCIDCNGDMNNDNSFNVLDVVLLTNCILEANCNI